MLMQVRKKKRLKFGGSRRSTLFFFAGPYTLIWDFKQLHLCNRSETFHTITSDKNHHTLLDWPNFYTVGKKKLYVLYVG